MFIVFSHFHQSARAFLNGLQEVGPTASCVAIRGNIIVKMPFFKIGRDSFLSMSLFNPIVQLNLLSLRTSSLILSFLLKNTPLTYILKFT